MWTMLKTHAAVGLLGLACGMVAVLGYQAGADSSQLDGRQVIHTMDCRIDEGTCPGDVEVTIIGGWPTDPLERCWLAMDLAGLSYGLCDKVADNLG